MNAVAPNARAHCQIRYTVDTDPAVFEPALRRHLDAEGFAEVRIENAGIRMPASRTDPAHPWVRWTVASMERIAGAARAGDPERLGRAAGRRVRRSSRRAAGVGAAQLQRLQAARAGRASADRARRARGSRRSPASGGIWGSGNHSHGAHCHRERSEAISRRAGPGSRRVIAARITIDIAPAPAAAGVMPELGPAKPRHPCLRASNQEAWDWVERRRFVAREVSAGVGHQARRSGLPARPPLLSPRESETRSTTRFRVTAQRQSLALQPQKQGQITLLATMTYCRFATQPVARPARLSRDNSRLVDRRVVTKLPFCRNLSPS